MESGVEKVRAWSLAVRYGGERRHATYRITALGFGGSATTRVALQSTYSSASPSKADPPKHRRSATGSHARPRRDRPMKNRALLLFHRRHLGHRRSCRFDPRRHRPNPTQSSPMVPPRILFAMSNDHALYYKAYTDWNDLDGNGTTDTTYLPTFSYYGYFDPAKCYAYENGRFVPRTSPTSFYCSGQWSGNFLNWATMSRMDIVRKVLYGGYRSTDTAAETVLERAFIPTDAHSFAKYYRGDDIPKLTPFSAGVTTIPCNTTYYHADSGQSQNVTAPPRISVVKGDFRYWAANERWQCTWDDERGNNSSGTNTTGSHTSDPNKSADGLGDKNYNARVQVCVPSLIGTENCRRYKDGSLKPIGLLHEYGEQEQLLFGLMTGSYAKNKSGGLLRKNISSFKDEVNVDTNGTFKGSGGIVDTLNRLRIARYEYGPDKGYYNDTDSCSWGLASFTDGTCSNWGNPLSEIYLESLRYLSGLSATSAFGGDDTSYISGLTSASWKDPLSVETWCAHCNVILINASETSYDHNSVDSSGL